MGSERWEGRDRTDGMGVMGKQGLDGRDRIGREGWEGMNGKGWEEMGREEPFGV